VKYTETAQYKSCSLPLCLPSGTPSTFYEHQQSTVRISVFQILYFEFQINFLEREKSFSLCHNAFHWVKHRTGAQKMLVMDTSLCASLLSGSKLESVVVQALCRMLEIERWGTASTFSRGLVCELLYCQFLRMSTVQDNSQAKAVIWIKCSPYIFIFKQEEQEGTQRNINGMLLSQS
jgi:hypothetical protein